MTLNKSLLLSSYVTGINQWFDTIYKLRLKQVEESRLFLSDSGNLTHLASTPDLDIQIENAQEEVIKMLRFYYEVKDYPEENIPSEVFDELTEELL